LFSLFLLFMLNRVWAQFVRASRSCQRLFERFPVPVVHFAPGFSRVYFSNSRPTEIARRPQFDGLTLDKPGYERAEPIPAPDETTTTNCQLERCDSCCASQSNECVPFFPPREPFGSTPVNFFPATEPPTTSAMNILGSTSTESCAPPIVKS